MVDRSLVFISVFVPLTECIKQVLSVRGFMQKSIPEMDLENCPLPYDDVSTAEWCHLRVGDTVLPIATYGRANGDGVSKVVCENNVWEHSSPQDMGLPKELMNADGGPPRVLDIGGNIGTVSVLFAQSGYKVNTIEAMLQNTRLIDATLCANPHLGDDVLVDHAIVGTPEQAGNTCKVCIDFGGNATVLCPNDSRGPNCNSWEPEKNKQMREEVNVKTLDQIIQQHGLNHHGAVDVVKMDIEGYEGEAMKGALELLTAVRPRYIMSEIQNNRPYGALVGVTPAEFVDKLRSFNYNVFTDRFGGTPLFGPPQIAQHDTPMFYFVQKGLQSS